MQGKTQDGERGGGLALPVRIVDAAAPWSWLAAGWRDLARTPHVSLCYGIVFSGVSFAITIGLAFFGLYSLILPLVAGFMLVGPLLAVGLYEVSRRLGSDEPVGFASAVFAWRRAPAQLALMGVLLMLFLLAWVRIATLIFALFFGLDTPAPAELITVLIFTANGLVFLLVGTTVGAVLAFVVFAITAVSIPLILDRDTFILTAIATSVTAVMRSFGPMLLWGLLIGLFTAAGIVTLYLGLIVFFPLIGHASWHAYRAIVGHEEVPPG